MVRWPKSAACVVGIYDTRAGEFVEIVDDVGSTCRDAPHLALEKDSPDRRP
jgi:hypothetical protein